MLIIGLIPFIVNLCRLGAAVYQIFIFRKYNTGCLKYVVNEDQPNQTIISQVKKTVEMTDGQTDKLPVIRIILSIPTFLAPSHIESLQRSGLKDLF